MPIPKVIPTKILAQYEEEELLRTTIRASKKGIEKKYLSIVDKKPPPYARDLDKKEANINPDEDGKI